MIIGLTGSMGMGKSTVSGMFRKQGVPVFCMDAATHSARGPHGAALPEIEALIPGATSEETGTDVAMLRGFAFSAPENFDALEAMMMPHIEGQLRQFLEQNWQSPMVVLDIPLLFEKGFDKRCDKTLVVTASADVQLERIMARGTLSEGQVKEVLARQWSDAMKRERAHYIITTDCWLDETEQQVRDIIDHLGG